MELSRVVKNFHVFLFSLLEFSSEKIGLRLPFLLTALVAVFTELVSLSLSDSADYL